MQLLLRLFVAPWKLFTKKLKNKTLQMMTKPLKIMLAVVVALIALGVVFTSLEDDYNSSKRKGSTEEKVFTSLKKSPENNSSLNPDNPNGTLNGLNLLLINKIPTEQYAKEYLELSVSNSKGELNNYEYHVPVYLPLAATVTETGFYDGTSLPVSYLPWDDSNNTVLWNKSVAGYPAEALTLKGANRNVFSVNYTPSYGSLTPYDTFTTVYGGSDSSMGPFQINGLGSNTSILPSVLNGHKEGDGRSFDPLYFPDNLSALDSRVGAFSDSFEYKTWSDDMRILLYSFYYNPGSGNAAVHELGGVSTYSPEIIDVLNMYISDLSILYKKYGSTLGNLSSFHRTFHSVIVGLLVKECGWTVLSGTESYTTDYDSYWEAGTGLPVSELHNAISSNTQSFSFSDPYGRLGARGATFLKKEHNGKTFITDSIAIGHAYAYLYIGQVIYGRMLKYAGVDVDPTDPSTYLNSIPEGEWKPSGDTAWMVPYIKDMSQLNSKRIAVLNEAYKWLGSWYTWGGVPVPEKDANGEWIQAPDYGKGFDCSSYVQHCIKTALGIDVSRSTYSQIVNENLEDVSESEAKPGDLIYYYYTGQSSTEHVAIYLGKENGVDIIMHAPVPGKRLCIAVWDGTYDESPTTRRVFKRVKGIDN